MYLQHPKESQTGKKRMRNNYEGLRKEMSLGLGEQTARKVQYKCVYSPHMNAFVPSTLYAQLQG